VTVPTIPELQEYRWQFDQAARDADAVMRNLSDRDAFWRPSPGRWSVAECIAHLTVLNGFYVPAIESSIAVARMRRQLGRGPFRYGFIWAWVVRSLEPAGKQRVRTPRIFTPPASGTKSAVLSEFQRVQQRLIALLEEADGIHLGRTRVRSPVSRFVRIPLGLAFAGIVAHERRHIAQAQRVRQSLEFPAGAPAPNSPRQPIDDSGA